MSSVKGARMAYDRWLEINLTLIILCTVSALLVSVSESNKLFYSSKININHIISEYLL